MKKNEAFENARAEAALLQSGLRYEVVERCPVAGCEVCEPARAAAVRPAA